MEGTSWDGTPVLQHHKDALEVESCHLKQGEGVYTWIKQGGICLEICVGNERTYLAKEGGCARVFVADGTRNSGECVSGYTLAQQLDRAGCSVWLLSV